jgi:hypothetical protein
MRKILPWLALAIAVIWIMHNPAGAGADVQTWLNAATAFASHL